MELIKHPVYLMVIYLRILLTATYHSSSSACAHSSGDLIIEPTFPFAKEGDIFNLTCTVRKTLEGFISWNIDPKKNNTYVSTAYDKERRELISILTVHVVSTAQYFSCDLRSTADQHVCSSSRMVHLRVQYFPKKKDISCSPRDPEPFLQGDVLSIFCQVLRSNPHVDMRWKLFPNTTILSLSPYRDRRVHRVLSHELSVTNDLHMKKLLCEVTSKTVFPDRSLQCFIGPIKVYQAPKVNVHPANAEIIANRPVKFSCVANGYPDEFTFTWSCLPHGVLQGCDSLSDTAEISYLVDGGEGFEAEITCAVSNSMGHALGFSRVKVLPFNVNPSVSFTDLTVVPLTCQPNDDNITLKVTVQTTDEAALNGTGVTVSCSFENILQERVEMQWYLGGNQLTEDVSYEIDQVTSFKSEITFFNVNGKDYKETLYCLVVLCNVTFTSSSVNLTRKLPSRRAHYHDYVPTYPRHASTANQPAHTIHATSQITSTYRPSPQSGQVSRREVIAIAFYGALASVIVISSVVILLSFIMFRRFKMASMNHTCTNTTKEQDVHVYMTQEDFTRRKLSDSDPIYDIPDTMSIKRDSEFCNTIDSGYATQVYPIFSDRINDSSDDCSSYVSSSLGCSSSRSSDISLERGVSNASIDIQTVETKASTCVVSE